MPTCLALSPHLDDAVFSCGGTLATLSGAGWRVIMATVFTATVPDPRGFALACQLDKGLGAKVDYMALRRNEDLLAARTLAVEPVWLPFREAPHRGYGSAAELFGPTRPDDGVGTELAPAIATLVATYRPDLVLAAQAIGAHVDHVQVVRAMFGIEPGCPILWWCDFPYTIREAAPRHPFGREFGSLPGHEVTLAPEAQSRRREACRCYASQLGFQFGGSEALDEKLAAAGPVESFRRTGPADRLFA